MHSMLRLFACGIVVLISQSVAAENMYSRFSLNHNQLDDSRLKSSHSIAFGLGYKLAPSWHIEVSHLNTGRFEIKDNTNTLSLNSSQLWLGYTHPLPWNQLQLMSQVGLHFTTLDSPQALKSRSEYGASTFLGLMRTLQDDLDGSIGIQMFDNIDKNNQLVSLRASLRFHF